MELSPEILFAIGLVASVVVWLLRLVVKNGAELPDWVLTSGVYVVSGVLAFFFNPVALPPFPPFADLAQFIPLFLAWIGDLLVPLSSFAGFAALVYQALLKKILDGVAARFKK